MNTGTSRFRESFLAPTDVPRKDFAPIGLIASMPVALLAHPSFPAKTIGDVVAVAKTAGPNFNIGTSAVGTGGYLTAELFKSVTGIDAAIIPYKGTAQVMNDLLGNRCLPNSTRASAFALRSCGPMCLISWRFRKRAWTRGSRPSPPREAALTLDERVHRFGLPHAATC